MNLFLGNIALFHTASVTTSVTTAVCLLHQVIFFCRKLYIFVLANFSIFGYVDIIGIEAPFRSRTIVYEKKSACLYYITVWM